jgi:hypothetical protein
MFTNAGSILPGSISTSVADVYILNGQDEAVGAAAAAIQQFVSSGGGLVIGAQAWYWSYFNPVPQHPSNLVLNKMGIIVSSTIAEAGDYTFTGSPPTQIGNIDVGISCIKDSCTKLLGSSCYMKSEEKLTAAMEAVAEAAGMVSLDAPFWATLQQVCYALPHLCSLRVFEEI